LGISVYLILTTGLIALIFLKVRGMVNPILWLCILFSSIFVGFFYYNVYSAIYKENVVLDRETVFEGIVYKDPRRGQAHQEIDLSLKGNYSGTVRIYAALYPTYNYGDLLEIKGTITKSPSGLNMISFPAMRLVQSGEDGRIKSFLFSVKNRLIRNLERVLPTEKSAFLAGILFGERAEFSDDFKEALQKSGTTHLVALSGYNVSIIAISLSNVLSYIGSRRRAFWLSIAFIILFVLMTGAEESVVRAAFMGIIFLISERSSRLYSFRNAIALTAFVMLLINPGLLVFNVGFQLSFAALLGLVYLKPVIEKFTRLSGQKTFLNWRENFIQTLSAQLAVLPVILYTFGYFSPLALFSNVLVLEFMPVTMFLGFVTAGVGVVSYHLSFLIGWVTGILLGYEIFIINFFGAYIS